MEKRADEKSLDVDKKIKSSKSKKGRKSKKNRKSDPLVNDISSLLSSSLCLVSPNGSFNTKNANVSPNRLTSKRKRNSKSISPNVSSTSLDSFVVRTSKTTKEPIEISDCDSKDKIVSLSDDEFDLKENRVKNHESENNRKSKRTSENNRKQKKVTDKTIEILNDNDAKNLSISTPQAKKNAFEFMMDSRNKSIGTNSIGKELKIETLPKDQEMLSARRSLLQSWADKKGGIKRKNDEVELDEVIAFKMDERTKRLKKLLNVSDSENGVLKIDSDAENNKGNKKKLNLQDFMGLLNKKKPGKGDDDLHIFDSEKEQEEVLKIKMFSPHVFKRRRHKSKCRDNQIEETNIENTKSRSKKLKSKKDLHLYSENSDASNDSDTFTLRRSSRKRRPRIKIQSISENEDSNDCVIDVEKKESKQLKKPSKVAPVFLLSAPKPKLDAETLEAKRKFLNSGIPDTLKKVIEKEKTYELDFDVFPKISHIQQKTTCETSIDFWNLPKPEFKFKLKQHENSHPELNKLQQGALINLSKPKIDINLISVNKVLNTKEILQKIKEENPEYPVFKCFRVLNEKTKTFERRVNRKKRRKSKEQPGPNYEMWTEKYKAITYENIIGNNKRVLELKKWLESWLHYTNDVQSKNNKKSYSSDAEFDIDSNSWDNMQELCNAMILTGPHGCGKTMSVYVLCNELGINVIELNASSKRTGKRLLQELQEATQSHQVRKNEALSNFLKTKTEVNNKNLCLLLVEDLDIVFDQDDGFLSSLSQLMITSKRPIIITTTDINCNYLQRFNTQYPIIHFSALSSKVLSVWFQILCLLEGIVTNSDDLGQLLEFYNGDARRTLLQLQFFVQSGGSLYRDAKAEESENNNKVELIQDEELNTSLFNDVVGTDNLIHKNCIYNFLDKNCLMYDLNLEKIWWNLPIVLNTDTPLEKCTHFSDALGVIDVIYTKSKVMKRYNSITYIKDSMELKERFDAFSNIDFIHEWSDTLLTNATDTYTEIGKLEFDKPTSGQKRWLRRQKDCRDKFSEIVPISCHVDKRNYALDYFPTLRAISRSETRRASISVKRRNRFYNYFRAFDFKCTELTNETACNIFSVGSDNEL